MKLTFALFSLLFAPFALAADAPPGTWYARVVGGTEPMTMNDKPVHVGDYLTDEGVLHAGAQGGMLVFIKDKNSTVALAPDAKVELADPKGKKTYEVLAGACRWKVGKNTPTKWLRVHTKSATMGVRGTEFVASYNPLLNESEIVVLEGRVEFASATDPKDAHEITTGHWGGIGGRFGKKIGPILELPPNVLEALGQPTAIARDPSTN